MGGFVVEKLKLLNQSLIHYRDYSLSNFMMRISYSWFYLTTLAVIAFLGLSGIVLAQEAGVSISPGVIEETLEPGTSHNLEIEIRNLNSTEQQYYLFTRNIREVADGGVPVFAEDWEATGFELSDWVELPFSSVLLEGDQEQTIPFTLNIPPDASCSHFGGIFISAEPPEIENSGAAVGYQVANILSIRVNGDCAEEANIRQFSTSKFMYGSQDVDFNVRIENTGDVLVRPIGPLVIHNALGKRVGEVMFNESRAGVLPGQTREFDAINWTGDALGFGRYEAVLSPVYGDDGAFKTMSSTVTFWILPFNIVGPALGILAVLLLVTIVGVKLYVRRALAQANVGRRMVRRRGQSGSSATLLIVVSVLIVLALFLLVMLVLFA